MSTYVNPSYLHHACTQLIILLGQVFNRKELTGYISSDAITVSASITCYHARLWSPNYTIMLQNMHIYGLDTSEAK